LKVKDFICFGAIIGLVFSTLPQVDFFTSLQPFTRNDNYNIKTNGLNESWYLSLNYFGQEITIDSNNCIYVMFSENKSCTFGCRYYGNVIFVKYNSTGDQIWRDDLEGLEVEYSVIAVDTEYNLYLASIYENRTLKANMILFKFNSSGDLQWQQTWEGGHYGEIIDIAIDSINNVYIYGTSDADEEFRFDLFIIKYNSSGNLQWFRIFGEIDGDYEGWDMEIDSEDNMIVSGSSFLKESYIHWIKSYNQSGNLNWNITGNRRFYPLALDSSDNIISAYRLSIMKYNNQGNLLWEREYNEEFWRIPNIAIDSLDDIYLGTSISIPEDHHTYDLVVFKINSSGSFEWYLTWGGPEDEYLRKICIDSNNNIYLLSYYFLIKNPENNGKSLTNIKLWNFYMNLFGICFLLSVTSLVIIIKRKGR